MRSPPQGNVWLRAPVGERISEVIWGTKKANLVHFDLPMKHGDKFRNGLLKNQSMAVGKKKTYLASD